MKSAAHIIMYGACILCVTPGWTQGYPAKPVRMVVGFSAGSTTLVLEETGKLQLSHPEAPLDLELVLSLKAPLVGRVVELATTFSSAIDMPDGPPPRG